MQVLKWVTIYLKHQVTIPIFSFVLSSYPSFHLHFLSGKLQWVSLMFRKNKNPKQCGKCSQGFSLVSLCRLFTGSFFWRSGLVTAKSSVFFHSTFKHKILNPTCHQATLFSWRWYLFVRRGVFSLLLVVGSALLVVVSPIATSSSGAFVLATGLCQGMTPALTTFLLHWENVPQTAVFNHRSGCLPF